MPPFSRCLQSFQRTTVNKRNSTWLSLILTVTNRLRLPIPQNGLQQILKYYQPPNKTHPASPLWLDNFSADILPVQCHAHNDYVHRVPLYEGLAVGCTSTEADIWISNNTDGSHELFVGHNSKSLTPARTLRSLYLDPLREILTHHNTVLPNNSTAVATGQVPISQPASPVGVFSMTPETSLILLLDFKMSGEAIWETVISQLSDFRAADWLTYWTPSTCAVQRPLTIVASGDASFAAVTANSTYRDIFFDAPLMKLSGDDMPYNSNNSYYASASLGEAVGKVFLGGFNDGQKGGITAQVERADDLGLKSRYWDTPAWPVGVRNRVWESLVGLGASVLNVDDLVTGARWDWGMCVVGGLAICSS
jgi:hypothetical protein